MVLVYIPLKIIFISFANMALNIILFEDKLNYESWDITILFC